MEVGQVYVLGDTLLKIHRIYQNNEGKYFVAFLYFDQTGAGQFNVPLAQAREGLEPARQAAETEWSIAIFKGRY